MVTSGEDGLEFNDEAALLLRDPTDASWTDGVASWASGTTSVVDALDETNELLSYLAPDDATSFDGQALVASGVSFYSGCLSAGNTNYKGGQPAGTCSVSTIATDATFTLATPASPSFNKADENTLAWYLNGALDDSFNLGTAFSEGERAGSQTYPSGCSCPTATCCGAAGNIEVDSVGWYNSFPKWQRGSAHTIIVPGDLRQGYNYFYMAHSGQTTATTDYFYDTDAGADPACATPTVTNNTPAYNYLSGLSFYKNTSTWNLSGSCTDLFDNVYTTSPVLTAATVTITPTSIAETDGSVSGVSTPPAIGETMTITNKVVTASTTSQRTTNLRFSTRPRDPYGSYTLVQSATGSRLYDSYGTTSTTTSDLFDDENRRLPCPNPGDETGCTPASSDFDTCPVTLTGQWTSTATMGNANAQVYQGALYYPTVNFTTYDPAGPNYSGFTGNQVYYRTMYDSGIAHSSGTLRLLSLVGADVGTVGAGAVNVELKLCDGETGWLDLGCPYDSGSFTGADGDCIRTAQSSSDWSWSVGTKSTVNSDYLYLLRITFRDSTRSIASAAEVGW